MKNSNESKYNEEQDRRIELCQYAPEWAEHARNYIDSAPCDDGRKGVVCGNREGEQPCPL